MNAGRSWIVLFGDALIVLGASASLVGLWMVWPPLVFIIGGALALFFGMRMATK